MFTWPNTVKGETVANEVGRRDLLGDSEDTREILDGRMVEEVLHKVGQ